MRDDTNKNTEEAVEDEASVIDWVDSALFNKTTVEKEESLFDWVNSVTAEYKIRFDAWFVEGGEGPVVCIRAIRGDKVSRPAYINAAYRNRREMRYAIESVIIEVLPT